MKPGPLEMLLFLAWKKTAGLSTSLFTLRSEAQTADNYIQRGDYAITVVILTVCSGSRWRRGFCRPWPWRSQSWRSGCRPPTRWRTSPPRTTCQGTVTERLGQILQQQSRFKDNWRTNSGYGVSVCFVCCLYDLTGYPWASKGRSQHKLLRDFHQRLRIGFWVLFVESFWN